MAITEYAYTERYVRPGGAGANDGTSWTDAWDLTQVAADVSAGKRFNISDDGTGFTAASDLAWNTNGTAAAPIMFLGWKGDRSAIAPTFADNPVIDLNANYKISPLDYQIYNRLRITNGDNGLHGQFSGADHLIAHKCEVDNMTNSCITTSRYSEANQCRIHDFGLYGAHMGLGSSVTLNEIYDGNTGVYNTDLTIAIIGNFIARHSAYGIRTTTRGNSVQFNTIDDCFRAISLQSTGYVVGNQFTNNTTTDAGFGPSSYIQNNFHGNTTDPTGVALDDGNTFIDPQYVDVANNDYEIQESTLIGVDFAAMLGSHNIGAWQSSGGGGGGGIPYRPRIRKGA